MTSPYLDRPLVPLAVALPQMLEKIEAELVDKTVGATEKSRLRHRGVGPTVDPEWVRTVATTAERLNFFYNLGAGARRPARKICVQVSVLEW